MSTEKGLFLFKFKDVLTMKVILEAKIWFDTNKLLVLHKGSQGYKPLISISRSSLFRSVLVIASSTHKCIGFLEPRRKMQARLVEVKLTFLKYHI